MAQEPINRVRKLSNQLIENIESFNPQQVKGNNDVQYSKLGKDEFLFSSES